MPYARSYVLGARLLRALTIDDVVDAAPVHFFCGAWGLIAVGFFARKDLVLSVRAIPCVRPLRRQNTGPPLHLTAREDQSSTAKQHASCTLESGRAAALDHVSMGRCLLA